MALRVLRPQREVSAHLGVAALPAQARRPPRVMEVRGASALDIARAVASKELSPVEVTEATLRRIEEVQPRVNAFAWVRERALDDARAAEKRLQSGESARALEGVPFTAKDLAALADGPTNQGSRAFAGHVAGADAEVVARLKRAGAILVATTTSSEFGNRPTTESDLFGATRNPWDTARTSGGSSGGAAVSAALGVAPINHGSDGGGSLRIPAFCCGVFALKPQRARVSLAPLMTEEWGGLDVYGAITRTVADNAAFLDAVSGYATGDPYWAPPPGDSFASATTEEPKRSRIAVAYERDGERIDAECERATRETAELLRALGHDVVEAQPDLLPLEEPYLVVSTVGIGVQDLTAEQLELLEPRTRVIVDAAAHVGAVKYARALKRMQLAAREVVRFWESFDLLLTPTLSKPAPPIGEMGADKDTAWDDYRNWLCWTWPFNCTGQPAANVPAGFTPDGLPLGVQLVGAPAAERTVLAVAAQLERARPWTQPRPPTW
jgi:amidase/aspartyl-tRNA(Asn)/glutamyl-tRNA(Gln) amidotransferase subunit A